MKKIYKVLIFSIGFVLSSAALAVYQYHQYNEWAAKTGYCYKTKTYKSPELEVRRIVEEKIKTIKVWQPDVDSSTSEEDIKNGLVSRSPTDQQAYLNFDEFQKTNPNCCRLDYVKELGGAGNYLYKSDIQAGWSHVFWFAWKDKYFDPAGQIKMMNKVSFDSRFYFLSPCGEYKLAPPPLNIEW